MRQCPAVFSVSLARFHGPLCAIIPSNSNSFDSLLYSFLAILLFFPSILQFFCLFGRTLLSSRIRIRFNILPCSLVPTCTGLQQFINFGPILCLACPEHFLHQRGCHCVSFQKTVEAPQCQHLGQVANVTVVSHRQTPPIQTVQKTVEVLQTHFLDRFGAATGANDPQGAKNGRDPWSAAR